MIVILIIIIMVMKNFSFIPACLSHFSKVAQATDDSLQGQILAQLLLLLLLPKTDNTADASY